MREYLITRIVLLTLCATSVLGAGSTYAQLSANFTASPTSGCTPVVVRFSDASTGNPTSWQWDLGNGTISFLQHPAATYFNPGVYTVKLVVSNGTAKDSIVKTQFIVVNAQPVVNLSASATTGCFPLQVQFSDLSEPGSGAIISREWDFGDGQTSTDPNPSHTYTGAGNFNVSLRVMNSNGCTQTITHTNYIKLTEGVKAGFSFSAPNNCKPPAAIRFTNTSTGTGTLSYRWDFGDGTGSTDAAPTHSYTATGIYTVKLVVRNNTGCADSVVRANAINIGTVKVDFSVPPVICAAQPITLTNTSAPTPGSAVWKFSDGTQLTGLNPVKTFANPGTYTVKLISDFGACKDSITKSIQVVAKPGNGFTATSNTGCKAPLPVSFTSQATGAVSYQWKFGDGGTATDPNPTHIYQTAGTFDVTLIVANAAGCTDTLVKKAFVRIQPTLVSITNVPQEGCIPYDFRPLISVTGVDPIVSYHWKFGDGGTAAVKDPSYTYTQAGTYTVELVYTTSGGCTDSVKVVDAIRVGNKPIVNFAALPTITCAGLPVQFTDQSTGGKADRWLWFFGDGGNSSEQHPAHIYQDTGYLHVKLVVWSNGCRDSLTKLQMVYIRPPVARFDVVANCANRLSRSFTDRSLGAKSWSWDFGDGQTSTTQSPTHNYAAPGSYIVRLTVRNETCEHTITKQVVVIEEKAAFSTSATEICKGTAITFSALNTNPQNVRGYSWLIIRNSVSVGTLTGINPKFTFQEAGKYDIRLTVTDINGCTDILTKSLLITVNGPTANFRPVNPDVCPGSTITFTDQSVSDGTHPIVKWTWNYGDGTIETRTGGPFAHTYAVPGVYNVQLTVTDNMGCTHSRTLTKAVNISRPVVRFISPDSLSCVGKSVRFQNQSISNAGTYTWYFGDGTGSTASQPTHIYTAEGDYSVKLVVHDLYGCSDSLTKTAYIRIRNPKAAFTVNDSVSSCPPLVVTFTNGSVHYNKVEWDFGDGNKSSLVSPTHFYTYPGTYRAKLLITSFGGCQDSAFKTILIKGPRGTFTYTPTSGCEPAVTRFTGVTNDAARFIWDFNDGAVAETNDPVISHTYLKMGVYLPKMILEDPAGCRVPIVGKDTIHIYGVEAKFTASRHLVCDSGLITFNNTSVSNDLITGYQWRFGDGGVSTQRNPGHFYRRSGLHEAELTVITRAGCRDVVKTEIPIKVVPGPAIAIESPPGACIPANLTFRGQLTRTDTSSLQWYWEFGNGTTSREQNPPAVTYTAAAPYAVRLIAINSSGCADTAQKTVQAYPLPALDAGADQTICRGNSIRLNATGANNYSWFPANSLSCTNCSTPLASPLEKIRYLVKGINGHGCETTDSVLINVKQPFTIKTHQGDTLCKGESLQLFASGAELYSWYPSSGLDKANSDKPLARPDVTVRYQVIGRDDHNCFTDTGYVPIVVYPYPVIHAGNDTNVSVGSSIILRPEISKDVLGIIWSPTTWLNCISCPTPVASPKQTIAYTLQAVNEGGCITRDEVKLNVFCNNSNLFVPNTFSPNSDGHNDVFYPRGKGVFSIRSLRIFNRWGDLVFQQLNFVPNDASKGWNGLHKGQLAPQDVYVYTLEIICENNTIFNEKGNITLIR